MNCDWQGNKKELMMTPEVQGLNLQELLKGPIRDVEKPVVGQAQERDDSEVSESVLGQLGDVVSVQVEVLQALKGAQGFAGNVGDVIATQTQRAQRIQVVKPFGHKVWMVPLVFFTLLNSGFLRPKGYSPEGCLASQKFRKHQTS